MIWGAKKPYFLETSISSEKSHPTKGESVARPGSPSSPWSLSQASRPSRPIKAEDRNDGDDPDDLWTCWSHSIIPPQMLAYDSWLWMLIFASFQSSWGSWFNINSCLCYEGNKFRSPQFCSITSPWCQKFGSQNFLITHVPASFLFLELVEASTALEASSSNQKSLTNKTSK